MNLSVTSAPHSSNEAPAACGAPGSATLPSPSGETTTAASAPASSPVPPTQRNTLMTTNDQLPDPQSLGYEEARDELVRIVQTLEGGQAPLEDTLTMWERGEALAARCSQILDGAQERLSGRTSTPSPEAR